MARCNIYAQVTTDNGRSVSIGGRGSQDRVTAWLNSDTAAGSDVACTLEAESIGERNVGGAKVPHKLHTCPSTPEGEPARRRWADVLDTEREASTGAERCRFCGERRPGSDTRQTVFTLRLPESPRGWRLEIETHGERFAHLLNMGAALCGAGELLGTHPEGTAAKGAAIAAEGRTAEDLALLATAERIELPGGVTLAEALSAVADKRAREARA